MLKLYTWTTPNGQKPAILLEELGIPYELHMVDLQKGEQKTSEYLTLNPNGKIPTLVDEDAEGGSLTIFESGAILIYLAEKAGKFLGSDMRKKYATLEWLMFQMAGVGPMFGQANHFIKYAPEKIEYGIRRYTDESTRLTGVLNDQLGKTEFLAGEYSIADMATWPWVRAAVSAQVLDLAEFPNVSRWFRVLENRSEVAGALKKLEDAKVAKG